MLKNLAHTAPVFSRLRVMTIFEINKLETVCFMFKINNQQHSSYFNDLFIQNITLHSHNIDNLLTIIYLTIVLKLDS